MLVTVKNLKEEDLSAVFSGKEEEFTENPLIRRLIGEAYYLDYIDKYNEWAIYSNPELLEYVVNSLYEIVKSEWKDYEFIASLGSSGAPITYNISTKYRKKAFFINDDWGVTSLFQPIKPAKLNTDLKEFRVLLVDSIYRSGSTVYNGVKTVENYAQEHDLNIGTDVLVITMLPEFIEKEMFEDDYDNIKIYYLYYWNEKVIEKAKEKGIIK